MQPSVAARQLAPAEFQADIGGLRAISVLMVVLYHFNLRLFNGGFIGVDIFFVISGFLMTKIIVSGQLAGSFSYAVFIWKRAVRIFPALFALVAVLLVLGAALLPPADLYSLARQSLSAVLFNSNNYYAEQQGYFAAGIDDRWLLHTWSLSVEWQFYVLYPLLVWLGLKLNGGDGPARSLRIFSGYLVSVFALSLLYCVLDSSQHAFFSVLTRCWQMLAGGLVYLAVVHGKPGRKLPRYFSYVAIGLILLALFLFGYFKLESVWPGYYATLPVLGAALLLAARDDRNWLLNNRVMQALGAWSYSIYLWHWPLVIGLTITGLLYQQPKTAKLLGVAASILLGYLSYRWVEPARIFKRVTWRWGGVRLLASGACLLLVCSLLLQAEGWMGRVRDPVLYRNLAAANDSIMYRKSCENSGLGSNLFCLLNQHAGGGKILVIGDSHAGHLFAWFERHATANVTFYVKLGCPLIPGFERVGADRNCREFTDKAYALAKSGKYQTVLISQNWTGFTPRSEQICIYQGATCVPLSRTANPEQVLQRVKGALDDLMDHHVQVVVLDATPYFLFNVPRTIARRLYWFGGLPASYDASGFFAENREYDALFAALKARPEFTLLSLRPQLCQQQRCAIYDAAGMQSIYKDADHFNPEWMAEHGQIFAALGWAGNKNGRISGR